MKNKWALAELLLIAFAMGFAGARLFSHRWYEGKNKPLLAQAVPIPSDHLPEANATDATAPDTQSPDGIQSSQEPDEATTVKDRAGAIALAAVLEGGKEVGHRAPEFRVQDLEGNPISLSSLRGKIVLLNFWATWCGICQSEMPSLEHLYQQFKTDSDFRLLSICVDDEGDQSKVTSLLEKNGYDFPVTIDASGEVGASYGIHGVPTTYVIDHSGRIAWSVVGGFDWSNEQVVQALQKML